MLEEKVLTSMNFYRWGKQWVKKKGNGEVRGIFFSFSSDVIIQESRDEVGLTTSRLLTAILQIESIPVIMPQLSPLSGGAMNHHHVLEDIWKPLSHQIEASMPCPFPAEGLTIPIFSSAPSLLFLFFFLLKKS
ncbi:uncharacterized protein BO97DRAFT_116086 [Aspergillus homomorphus CBS 101889]|uniref:Uncharacterized protein n=1 Tax=Aspergillus homomorphus (strain CBS 101889) TaxID=1450537 RepID=A0A395HVP0_ASPHC|nr:hypothetical protein BO97DRAFT_116086 [Aspergillus homomorphus CBS 101889]RAL10908.1 hypothetical protein BO97DRAFT_116086 [Aspergillus homomorphus CBS 101889]